MKNNALTWVQVDLKAIRYNLKTLSRLAAGRKFHLKTRASSSKKKFEPTNILPVIKADAYGHGMEAIARSLNKEGIEFFGVSDVNEGIRLRRMGIKKTILLFESTLVSQVKPIVDYRLTPTVCTFNLASALNRYAKRLHRRIDIHINVDTGMRRLGIWHVEAYDFIKALQDLRFLRIMGIYTHFPAADSDRQFTKKQIDCLYHLVTRLDRAGLIIPYIHAANSMGLVDYPTHVLNLARPGLMLYGLYPHPNLEKIVRLKPALSVKSQIILVKRVKKGQSVSYGRTFFAKKDMNIAIIPIGYNDGYVRHFSNKASVLIGGRPCPVVGRVTMDQIMVDVSSLKSPKVGMAVTILGRDGRERITAEELARYADTINYEIICS